MDQDLQDLKKINLVELEVIFNEHESESIDSPIEKKT